MVELLGSYPRGQLDLPGSAKLCPANASRRNTRHHASCRLSQHAPYWNEDLLHSRVVLQPLSDGRTLVARKIVGDQVEVAGWVCLGNRFEQPQVTFGVARGSDKRESLAVSHPQRTINPDLLQATALL